MGQILRDQTEDLQRRIAKIQQMGGAEAVAKQHGRGKQTARERVDALFDAGSFVELMIHGRSQSTSPMMAGKETPADGVICGHGLVDGRRAAVIAYDFTVMAGSIGQVTELKCQRLRSMAIEERMPVIWLLDSAGARVQEVATAFFAGSGQMFYDQVVMSGLVPQVAAMMGPCAAGTAYVPGLADFVPMVKGTSSMALAGPHLVKAATGADYTSEELGGSKLHTRESGVADLEVADDSAMMDVVKRFLSFFPSHCDEPPPRRPCADPVERAPDELLDLVPDNPRAPMDMRRVIELVVDQVDGQADLLELKPKWGKAILTTLARLDGQPVGLVASNSSHMGGILTNDPADKAARFINLCDAFGVPLIFLQDVPGFMVGPKTEKEGIIRHGAKMLYAVSRASVPKLTVVVRKGYGAGYYVMCGKGYRPDLIVAWPGAEVSVMGPEGAVNIAFRKQIEASDDPDATRAALVAQFRDMINPYEPASWTFLDDVIDPRRTRQVLIQGLRMAAHKRTEWPARRHGVMPV
ncbi:MAG: acyl-CoA carboxylase subunit beta [Pseudomonadota bacterium]